MRKAAVLTLVLMLSALAVVAETPAPAKAETPAAETATYTVPGLDQEATLKSLSKSLKDLSGIVSARADAEGGTFAVTFEPGKTNPDEILKAVNTVAPEAKLKGVGSADPKAAAKHDCGKCPSKSSCGSKK